MIKPDNHLNLAVTHLLDLKLHAEKFHRKYEYDPHLGPTHEVYLDTLNTIINELSSSERFKNALR